MRVKSGLQWRDPAIPIISALLRRLLTLALLSLVALSACAERDVEGEGGAGASAAGGGAPQGPPPVPVIVVPAELREYAPAIELVGDIRAMQRATLAAEVAGRVTRVGARVGGTVRKGEALITIDSATYRASLASAEASLEQARQALLQTETGPRSETIAAQEAAVAAAQARYDAARDNLDRQQRLFDEGVVSESALVAARSQAQAAEADLNQQHQRLEELRAGSRPEELAAAKARVDAAISSLELARLSLERTIVAPPFNAMVSQLLVEEGQYVAPGIPLAEVVSAEQDGEVAVEAWFNLPEAQARQVSAGSMVELRADALAPVGETPPVIQARVTSVAPAADPVTRQFPVRVAVDDARLRPGMAVRGRLLTQQPQQTLMVPADSTTQSTLGLVVYKMLPPSGAEGELPGVEAVNVEIGENVDNLVVVRTGEISPGDMIVTRGKEQLYPGAKIIPTNLQQPGGEGAPPGAPPGGPPADEAADAEPEVEAGAEASSAEADAESRSPSGESGN